MAPTKASDLAFDATLLVRPVDAGQAEERVEEVVTAKRHEAFRLDATATLQYRTTAVFKLS